ncbi:acyl-CoA thioesterase [Sneathiella litorea]|uniref:YbgC/FadM family acyl-CoA thioesterase n=1 Tax=Sneathiella litorea TaxID=2606216 RepID=A0A6L8WBX7_9PROT|nr:thioesterase family protein [Sneathiella litorea]MZR32179.1 YbgC/FadM family acyl-CoA thioesterase [Sneathiella litorea]
MARQDYRFFHPFRVRYSEIDAQSVVFNAHYLTYFDTAITEFFRHLGYDHQGYVKRTGKDFHLVKSLVLYEKPILFDAEIEVGVRIEKIGRSSITFALAIFAKGEETRYCTGEIVWVNTDQTTHKPEPVDNEFLELFETFETVKK